MRDWSRLGPVVRSAPRKSVGRDKCLVAAADDRSGVRGLLGTLLTNQWPFPTCCRRSAHVPVEAGVWGGARSPVACSRGGAHLLVEGCAVLLGAARRVLVRVPHSRL